MAMDSASSDVGEHGLFARDICKEEGEKGKDRFGRGFDKRFWND